MTAQMCDFFVYQDEPLCLMGYKGGSLPDATDFGMKFLGGSTADWRGFCMWYGIHNNALVIKRIEIRGIEVEPITHAYQYIKDEWGEFFEMENFRINFTGHILFTTNSSASIASLWYSVANEVPKVYEAEFHKGNIIRLEEISSKIKAQVSGLEADYLETWGQNEAERLRNLRLTWDKTTHILGRRYDVLYLAPWYINFPQRIEDLQNNIP